jgi:hypothetical protein
MASLESGLSIPALQHGLVDPQANEEDCNCETRLD